MGATCVRQCERSDHELAPTEDTVLRQNSLSVHSLGANSGRHADVGHGRSADVKVGTTSPDPLLLIGGGGGGTSLVPPLENWFKVASSSVAKVASQLSPRETPRFDEVASQGSARANQNAPASSMRLSPEASPRESPRPPDERRSPSGAPMSTRTEEISYEGTYLGSMKHGTGRLQMSGSVYEGDFMNDSKHGAGVLTWDDGRQYRGQFVDGKFSGTAVMTWPDGRKYTGEYTDDRKHGEGTFSWQDGRRYAGQWVAGKRHGIGIYTNAKGVTRTGTWNMDRPVHWEEVAAKDSALQGAQLEKGKVTNSKDSSAEESEKKQAIEIVSDLPLLQAAPPVTRESIPGGQRSASDSQDLRPNLSQL